MVINTIKTRLASPTCCSRSLLTNFFSNHSSLLLTVWLVVMVTFVEPTVGFPPTSSTESIPLHMKLISRAGQTTMYNHKFNMFSSSIGLVTTNTNFITRPNKTRLWQRQQESDEEEQGSIDRPGTARFMNPIGDGSGLNTGDATSTLDSILSFLSSDLVSVVLGLVGLLIVVVHRLTFLDDSVTTSTQALAEQTRTDLLAVFACGSVLLNGITKLDVTSALSESVVLQGIKLDRPEIISSLDSISLNSKIIQWGLEALLSATPAQSAIILNKDCETDCWDIQARGGILPPDGPKKLVSPSSGLPAGGDDGAIEVSTPILDRVGSIARNSNGKETYLPTLQALPGRFEFVPYLPSNTQLVLIVPIFNSRFGSSLLVLGSNTAKSFTPRDVAWSRVIAERMMG